jgi:hypothetical protein
MQSGINWNAKAHAIWFHGVITEPGSNPHGDQFLFKFLSMVCVGHRFMSLQTNPQLNTLKNFIDIQWNW